MTMITPYGVIGWETVNARNYLKKNTLPEAEKASAVRKTQVL